MASQPITLRLSQLSRLAGRKRGQPSQILQVAAAEGSSLYRQGKDGVTSHLSRYFQSLAHYTENRRVARVRLQQLKLIYVADN